VADGFSCWNIQDNFIAPPVPEDWMGHFISPPILP